MIKTQPIKRYQLNIHKHNPTSFMGNLPGEVAVSRLWGAGGLTSHWELPLQWLTLGRPPHPHLNSPLKLSAAYCVHISPLFWFPF